jgi:hypothetical protein
MYFQPDGRVSTAHETWNTVTLRPNIVTASGLGKPCLCKREIREQIRCAVKTIAEHWVSPEYRLDRIAVLRVEVDFRSRAVVEKVLRIPLSCDGTDDLAGKTLVPTPLQALRGYVAGRALLACVRYRVDEFVDEMNAVARCLHMLRHWNGDDVHEIVVTLGVLGWLAERHGRRIDDFYELERRPMPLDEDIRTGGLDGDEIWFCDRSGHTLIIDRRGRLVEGPTVAERLGRRIPSEPAAISRAREIERGRIETALLERLWGAEEEAREAEDERAAGELPF